jgi:hypothetical protein
VKLAFRSSADSATVVAGNVPALWGSSAFNSAVALTSEAVVNSQSVMDIMEYQKLYPADEQTGGGAYINFDIPAWAKQATISLYNLETDGSSSILLEMSDSAGVYTLTTYGGTVSTGATNVAWSTLSSAILTSGITESSYAFHGKITLVRAVANYTWCLSSSLSGVGTAIAYNGLSSGVIAAASAPANFRLALGTPSEMFINGTVSVVYR